MNRLVNQLLHRKAFLISLVILLFFIFIASAANYLTPYKDPYTITSEQHLAAPYSIPIWARIFPQYSKYPPNTNMDLKSPLILGNGSESFNGTAYTVELKPSEYENLSFPLSWNYQYPYSFSISFIAIPHGQAAQINVLLKQQNKTYFLESFVPSADQILYTYPTCPLSMGKTNSITISSESLSSSNSPYVSTLPGNERYIASAILPQLIFKPGKYSVIISIENIGTSPLKVYIYQPKFSAVGRAYGILGTDNNGASVFAEFVLGARFDLEIAAIATLIIVGIGLIFGLVAGYVGGKVDLFLNALTDFFLTIPGLPLLITLETIFVVSGLILKIGIVPLLIAIIGGLSWMGTMKIIRSVTLSVRSRTFVEASKALGSGPFRIIRKHVLPNILGVVFAQIAYDVPVVILTESGLDFLGLGITKFPTWGNMLGYASAYTSPANGFVWWWVLPPGFAIIFLSVALYFIGSTLQDVLSPYKVRGE
ncbi:peptide transporter [Candidatus Acidianus copahuensis]|uniref:Peptide transporter n=1 Tax=Candidatus Acidianus copahuensis TaxID=1160895 RepID=A0A031LLE6_9CREN|nr:ABC transporter permease [Candidatus Acidianus copahuensis]EZQ04882.1 peptide transporter [Candidatus Acidianus copahuensis]